MTLSKEPTRDQRGDDPGPNGTRLTADLAQVYRSAAPPPHLDAAVLQAIRTAALEQGRPRAGVPSARRLRLRLPTPGFRYARPAALVAATMLTLSGAVGALHVASGPTFASAQTVLRRAAAVKPAPNAATHLVDAVTMTYEGRTATGTADVWLQTDARGVPTLSVQTLTLRKSAADSAGSAAAPPLNSRFIQVGAQVLAYNPELRQDNTILLSSVGQTRAYPSWAVPNDVFDGAGVAQSLSTLAQKSPQQVRLLPQQTLDGHAVEAIEVDGWTDRPAQRTILYFDAQSYVLRGFDASSLDPSYPTPVWQARLSSETTMPASAAPPHTFALDAPPTATVAPLDLGGPAFPTFAATVTATCHSPVNVKELLRSGQSLLAACQATNPGVTAGDLVAALAGPDKAALDAAVAANVLTPAQADAYLGQAQGQLTAWVTAPRGSSVPSTTGLPSK